MNNNIAAHFSAAVSGEQESNGVQSGFAEPQLFVLLNDVISQWKECERLDVLLLRAICSLSIEQPEQAKVGFTPWDIVDAVTKLRGRVWSRDNGKEQKADDVRRQWKKLEKLWTSKSEGIREVLLNYGIQDAPSIERAEGGGTGNPTRYKITWVKNASAVAQDGNDTRNLLQKADIRYICEDIEDAGPIARFFTKGYELAGWKKHFYRLALLLPILICYLLFVQVVFGFTVKTAFGFEVVSSLASFVVVFGVIWYTLTPLYDVPINKITVAPWWMQSIDDDRLIELRGSPEDKSRSIKAVRYSASCPICGGRVYAKAGGWAFRGRVVGKCERNPVEHVFSFDYITRVGKYLR